MNFAEDTSPQPSPPSGEGFVFRKIVDGKLKGEANDQLGKGFF